MGQAQSATAPLPVSSSGARIRLLPLTSFVLDDPTLTHSRLLFRHHHHNKQEQPPKPAKKLGIKTGKPICCCCPDTKQPRDECVVMKGEDHPDCIKLIEAHKACLRAEGFDVK